MTPTPLLRLMTKVAQLYYEQGLRQAEIADRLDLSQSRVSRLLKQAEKEGIVRTTVALPQGFYPELEDRLQVLYGLREAVVADCERDDDQEALRAIGAAAAAYIETTVSTGEILGISSWSETLLAMLDNMHPQARPTAEGVVQILGGAGNPSAEGHATRLTSRLAQLVGGEARFLPAPGRGRLAREPARAARRPVRGRRDALDGGDHAGDRRHRRADAVEAARRLWQRLHRGGAARAAGARRGRRHLPALLRRRRRARSARRSTSA